MKRGCERNVTSSLRNGSGASYETHLWVLRNADCIRYETEAELPTNRRFAATKTKTKISKSNTIVPLTPF